MLKGTANWTRRSMRDEAFKQLTTLDKDGIKARQPMIVYTSTDDTGFTFIAEIPVDQDVESRQEHEHGQFARRQGTGSSIAAPTIAPTPEAITNHLDDKSSKPRTPLSGVHHRSAEDCRRQT